MKKLCSRYHRSFKFFREFCSNYFDVFTRDIKPYKQNFLLDELPPDFDNRRKYFKRMIKCYCLLSMMLLESKERTIITVILDRFHFETQRNTESDRRTMMSAFQDVLAQYELVNSDPYFVIKNHLQFLLNNQYELMKVIDKFQFKATIHFYEIQNRKIEIQMSELRSFVVICGFNKFKNYLNNLED